jgi:hypothetical protein
MTWGTWPPGRRNCGLRREAELREEYARLHAGGSDHSGTGTWQGLMRRAGRVQ